jgi:ABC-type Na+ efflux pump permease subunit
MSRFLMMVKRELKSLTREKTIMLAIIIQLFLASFSSVIVIGLMSFLDPASIGQHTRVNVDVGIVDDTQSPLIRFLRDRNLKVTAFASAAAAEKAFYAGQVDTVMLVPKSNSDVVDMKLILPELDSKATVILMVLAEPLKRYESYLREANGVDVNFTDLKGRSPTTYEFLYSLIVPILMLFPALLAGSIVIDTVSEEIENKTLDTLRSTPVSFNEVLAAKIFAAIITVFIQCFMWAMLLRVNHVYIQNLGLVLLFCGIIGTFISLTAAIIALCFKDRERSQFTYSIVLVVAAGLSYLLSPSPFNLLARLATGDHYTGAFNLLMYFIPLVVLGMAFFRWSEKLVSARSIN